MMDQRGRPIFIRLTLWAIDRIVKIGRPIFIRLTLWAIDRIVKIVSCSGETSCVAGNS